MQPQYVVEMSETAEIAFTTLFGDAQHCLNRGDKTNHKVTIFKKINEALDSLSSWPFDRHRALVGRFSNVYIMNIDSVCFYYHIDVACRRVFVRSIEITKTHPDLSWVRKPEFRSQATKIFDVLGIDGTDFLNERPPFAVH